MTHRLTWSRTAFVVALALSSASLAGCSTDSVESPDFIEESAITGSLTPRTHFDPAPSPPCDMESGTVLRGVRATSFKAWDRKVGGHTERVAVGFWKMDEATATHRLDALAAERRVCRKRPESDGYMIEGLSAGGEESGGLDVWRYQSGGKLRYRHAYSWAPARESTSDGKQRSLGYGYMVTVWLERTDGSKLSADLDAIMDAQLHEIPGY